MRIPLSWLQEFINLSSWTPDEIANMLTMAGLEVDHIETIGTRLQNIVVARVIETHKHPNADKLTVASVTDGQQIYQIVCGAPNCRSGMKTALARIGAVLGEGDDVFTIKKAKLRGVDSEGMLCAAEEVGLPISTEGIMELPHDLVEGTSLYDIYADTYFDISLTPNLSHCTSVFGVARELAAITGQPLLYPQIESHESEELIEHYLRVRVIDQDACPRYACRLIRNVKIASSPKWLRERIEKCGLRSVNNVVDVTNYVLLEMGHPLHAFDYDKLEGQEVIVRKAGEKESIETLDQKPRLLKESMLMICDSLRPIAIAGVMGGANSDISDETHHLILESAYFDPMSIRRTSKQLGLQTDASKRFERGTDPNHILAVLDRAALLIQQVAGGNILSGVIDCQSKEFPEAVIPCRLSRLNQLIGRVFSRGEVEEIFVRLQFPYQWDGHDQFLVHTPTYRGDIKWEIDLIEEVARLYGYDNIPREGGRYQASRLPSAPMYLFENEVRLKLIQEGLQELLTCDLIGPSLLRILYDKTIPDEGMVKVLNPTSVEQSILRTSLLPGLLQVAKYNVDHQHHDIAGFEVGRIHFHEGEQYKEQSVAAILLMGQACPSHWDQKGRTVDFFDLKGIVQNLFDAFGISNYQFKNLGLETFHSGRQASIFVGSLEVGTIGEIHPAIQRRLDVPQRLLFGEFNLQDLMQIVRPLEKVIPLAIYPSSERDWTLTIKQSVPFAKILQIIHEQHSLILEDVTLKDLYRSEKIGFDNQNLTLHFVYRDLSKTIEQDVVEVEHLRLTTAVLNQLSDAVKI
ncbi:MAG: phenylalanine--tRNA ligase subunit beta [Parachlamydiaceae bacterium]